ncbi:alpha/beta family hydrolase [Alteromonas flava]|uniref:alpha/beta family hydrolase n=1 Tax=Alteromonas flava TaxID=2048003 RepID=UPI000C28CFDF|nr:alpha/beta family hydrolase [Alteromonas flava]
MMQCFKPPTGKKTHLQIILAHGAGAGMQSEFMQAMANALSQRGVLTWLFNFPYMQIQESTGKKRPPDRAPKLLDAISQVLEQVTSEPEFEPTTPLLLGGKSMGGRMMSMWAAEQATTAGPINGVVALGYPFHPPGKPDKLRIEHFSQLPCNILIIQGERDTFGNQACVAQLTLPSLVNVRWLADGDHSFKPRKSSGLTQQQHILQAADWIAQW